MDNLPIFLTVKDRRVLVDGGGSVAARRVERALSAGAHVLSFDPDPGEDLMGLIRSAPAGLTFERRLPVREDVADCLVVYGASEDEGRDEALYGWSREFKVLCNIADVTDKCDFVTPSIVDRSPVVVAISTGGAAPVIARTLRARIETMLTPAYGQLAAFVGQFRERIAAVIEDGRERRHFWERMIDGPVGDHYLAGDAAGAMARFDSDLRLAATHQERPMGEVYLVGAGPGDPDLLTFRALRLMQRADVVLYDRLVGEEIISLVRRDAERIYVGKLPKEHTMEQHDISALMAQLARQGNRVLRLKGGDPFIFGRGGEEIEALAEQGVPFRIVPGITASAGCGAYAGIPLTHRDHAQSCLFVTAHGKDGVLDLDWEVLIRPAQTVAVYMGLSNLATLVEGFRRHGVSMQTDIAVIENGTRPDQRVLVGTLGDIVGKVNREKFRSPSMIIIGSVVQLRERLATSRVREEAHAMSLVPEVAE
ncbi:siroheme synthase CysG [Aliiruegeria lutimaris]|uniref:Uroporphyrin-III C-methyltransferase / precorrin-2 dehydrogenase / sirohydrochlorin ferrochelatase n=1 Tax=Aliiruegeria lutimaris TaxID=571298 RepID=A0A1G8S7E2_9RHOB|nr:siroheme synthase CysG [Aliiruegeria lutimaris]SDJ25158.1 uroporphyrin-III C-methyltransferase / precorrin-2 dehydrogenase / sirohydrochlorin ferrochelatase [Aliiruegeria lutimaris]